LPWGRGKALIALRLWPVTAVEARAMKSLFSQA
jgi:hypothetical protein